MTPEDASFQRLACHAPSDERYGYLRDSGPTGAPGKLSYFFALDLHQSIDILPRLLGSIVQAIHFLGPHNCALSVTEGRSTDGTFEILKLLRPEIEGIGATYFFNTSDSDPLAADRVEALAGLRNLALENLVSYPEWYSPNATVIFLNDVVICVNDILELVHQRVLQKADMTCAMDWTYVGPDPTFYDVWVARGMNGDTFFDIPSDGSWDSAWELFWNNPTAEKSYDSNQAFQVFSCWNGAAAFTARPLLEQKIQFRGPHEGECYQGEPQLFCQDMWRFGYGRIAVVPSVNLGYSDKAGRTIQALKGQVSRHFKSSMAQIEWKSTPPELVKCMASSYKSQPWVAWNETLK
ncbi:MAG: hypothetical protein M1818_004511 [Claussenomyces sp. TS43310]|nr:MAG: hypothetical protein M1818_004511 [Claussenomyces sp. TS43310]